MAIDFTLPPEVLEARDRIRAFMQSEMAPTEAHLREKNDLRAWRPALQELREKAKAEGLWAPHMPREWGGMGLRPLAMAFVSAECGRQQFGA
ncbi:MAG TPA: acyl-CoA dehydrogenase family protein, partial [Myxococcota bacterium]|nr:acyl-CoA dehydrogenase family protein [Myxococcota bacterium]